MTNRHLRRYVDILMYLALCFVTGTGLLIGYRLAPCSRGGDDGCTLWGLGRHDWGTLHLWVAFVLLGLLLVHLLLNFAFIRNVVFSRSLPFLLALAIAGVSTVIGFMVVPINIQPGGKKCGSGACASGEDSFVCPARDACSAEALQATEENDEDSTP